MKNHIAVITPIFFNSSTFDLAFLSLIILLWVRVTILKPGITDLKLINSSKI